MSHFLSRDGEVEIAVVYEQIEIEKKVLLL